MLRKNQAFAITPLLQEFAVMCQNSKEYQGHGWGMSFRDAGGWHTHKSLTPIWEDQLPEAGDTDFLLIHARSAFRNEGICLENNMPFSDGSRHFIFNGELHGVRIREDGRIGAEKIFNYIRRFDKDGLDVAFQKAIPIIHKRTNYVRGMNVLMTDGDKIYAATKYGEDPEYFTLFHHKDAHGEGFCSQPLSGDWQPLANNQTMIV